MFFHSSAVVPGPNFAGKLWTEDPDLILWLFYLLFSIGMDKP